MKEYQIISEIFAPLASNYQGALGLTDDIAIFPKDEYVDYVISTDAMVEGKHFLENSIPEAIAARLLTSNISDLASAGATPKFYLINGSISERTDKNWLKDFANKLSRIQKENNIHLLGGDTIKVDKELFFSATVIGEVRKGKALLRSGAKAGDDIYVSGSLGESYIGLQILRSELVQETNIKIAYEDKNYFINRYVNPKPRVKLGQHISSFANSCTDVSDGFILDLENICKTSKVSAKLDKYLIPLAKDENINFDDLISAGDDYELIFTASPSDSSKVTKVRDELKINITKVGSIIKSDNDENIVQIFEASGAEYKYTKKGYQHETSS